LAPPLSEHRITRRVHFHETDAAGIVHFSRYFHYMEEGENALWRAAGLSIHPPGSEIGWPRRSVAFDYYRPLRFEDEFEIGTRIVAIDESTIRYRCLLTRGQESIARGKLAITCVSLRPNEPMRMIPIPPDIAARFRAAPEEDA
jgi:YbgC/YbaW family acyl-CoA thioester hydrolase